MRTLSGERVLSAGHDGTVKMWDVRMDTCVATVGRCSSAVLCMDYDDSTGILAAAGRDMYVTKTPYLYFCTGICTEIRDYCQHGICSLLLG